MDAQRFDRLATSLTTPASRRGAVVALVAGLVAPLAGDGPSVEGKRRRKKKRCRPKCDGRVCGPNGCRGNCGPGCADEEFCRDGACVECLSRANCPADPNVCTTFVCDAAGACVVTPVANGTSCGGENQCRNGACGSPPQCAGVFDSCIVNGQCCSNDCNPDPNALTCRLSPDGGACKVDNDCASGDCVAFVCV